MLSVVIPVYREPNILEFRQRLVSALVHITKEWEIIWCVGDPLTYQQLCGVGSCLPEKVIYEQDRGLGRAISLGFKNVSPSSEWILTMDSDLQQLPEEIPKLWNMTLRDCNEEVCYDIVIGSKELNDSRGLSKRLLSKALYWAIRHRRGIAVRDMGSNFRLYRRWIVRRLPAYPPAGYQFMQWSLIEAHGQGANIVEVPTTFAPRTAGKSKMSMWRELRERLL